jgi:magnesium transporter
MIERHEHKNCIWLDVCAPSPEELRLIIEECNIPLEYTYDLLTTTPKTEVLSQKQFLKITLDFPIVKRTDIHHPHEVKFLITKKHLVTIRFEEIESLHRFRKEYEVLCAVGGTRAKIGPDTLFLTMLAYFYDALYAKLDYLETRLKDIEEEIFSEHEEAMVYELSQVSRRLISFRQTIDAHDDALTELVKDIAVAFATNHTTRLEAITHQYKVVRRRLKALFATFSDLRRTNDSLLETKQNTTMRIFTILAFITFPLTLFSSMFGMNTAYTPIVGTDYDFWIILGAMAFISMSFFTYFRYRKWL